MLHGDSRKSLSLLGGSRQAGALQGQIPGVPLPLLFPCPAPSWYNPLGNALRLLAVGMEGGQQGKHRFDGQMLKASQGMGAPSCAPRMLLGAAKVMALLTAHTAGTSGASRCCRRGAGGVLAVCLLGKGTTCVPWPAVPLQTFIPALARSVGEGSSCREMGAGAAQCLWARSPQGRASPKALERRFWSSRAWGAALLSVLLFWHCSVSELRLCFCCHL